MGTCLPRFGCGWGTWSEKPRQTVGQEVEPAELPSSSLFRIELEGLEVGGKLGLVQRMGGGGGTRRTGQLYGGRY